MPSSLRSCSRGMAPAASRNSCWAVVYLANVQKWRASFDEQVNCLASSPAIDLRVIHYAARTARYSSEEVQMLAFSGFPPDAGELSRRWRSQLDAARITIAALPATEAGKCVLDRAERLLREPASSLTDSFVRNEVHFHSGAIRGALPQLSATATGVPES